MTLADKIRTKMERGELPTTRPEKVWTGFGALEPCAACDHLILKAQSRYAFDPDERSSVSLHLGCFGVWLAELRRRGCDRFDREPAS
jgi:hypothetical protein